MENQPPTLDPNRIRMSGGQFGPATLTVSVGATVTWVNTDPPVDTVYSVTSGAVGIPNGLFNSGLIMPEGSYQFTFTVPGVYPYFSESDPNMIGEIIADSYSRQVS